MSVVCSVDRMAVSMVASTAEHLVELKVDSMVHYLVAHLDLLSVDEMAA